MMKNILMKESLFPIAYRKCGMSIGFFLHFISVFLFSQTFNKNNPAVTVKENVTLYVADDFNSEAKDSDNSKTKISTGTGKPEIYIAKGVHIYGAEHFGNSKLNEEKTIARKSVKKKWTVRPKLQKAKLYKPEEKPQSLSYVKPSGNKDTFFAMSGSYLGFAILNNNPIIQKFQIVYEDLYISIHSFAWEDTIIFSFCDSSLVKEKVLAHYSRPPPFMIDFTA
ncbi:hypothetical protein [Chryseobacterium sp. MEBOG07]|uniref:hypothetical protein n=1 Tax=Chryseobacterium sp. MEBOG07 TaxID=2879939 RepID=UPI001F1E8953|nr:hypothetical protein [Chryseobacterium sp. MEBOG07]UKB79472.1 hypothetical protein LF886_00250 [Chryseobacterium sp. MEBOG07]